MLEGGTGKRGIFLKKIYLAAPQPTLRHYQGNNLIHTAFLQFGPEGHREPRNEIIYFCVYIYIYFHVIYPSELQLKCEHRGLHATSLDLLYICCITVISITAVDGIFEYKLYDER